MIFQLGTGLVSCSVMICLHSAPASTISGFSTSGQGFWRVRRLTSGGGAPILRAETFMPEILFLTGLLAALAYLPVVSAPPAPWRSALKTLPLSAFALAAGVAGGPPALFVALALSALGDLALSFEGRAAFLAGLGSFALAHLAFIALFLALSGAPLWSAFALQPGLAVYLVAVGLSAEVWLVPHVGALRWPVRAYVVAITLMGLAALTLPLGRAALGAGLFILSDVILALRLFRLGEDSPLSDAFAVLLWIAYVGGQTMIVTAVL
ncbi:MAG: lysoplasmalogenase [Alphaproteobacteria bacterium]|nr:MAG: lysoplasmalogenase [Alphaproteobacteria bacterium]